MRTSKVLRRLVEVAPPLIAQCAKPGPHCIASTAIGLAVLARFGVEAEPYVVAVSVCNAGYMRWLDDGCPDGDAGRVARGGYLVTNAPEYRGPSLPSLNPPAGRGWNGHLVIRAGDKLVDLDLGALARPTHGIYLPTAFVGPLSVDGRLSGTCEHRSHTTHVDYRAYVSPDRDEYLTARDWCYDYSEDAAVIARRMRRSSS